MAVSVSAPNTRDWAKWNLLHPYIKKGRKHGVHEAPSVSRPKDTDEHTFGEKAGEFGSKLGQPRQPPHVVAKHTVSESGPNVLEAHKAALADEPSYVKAVGAGGYPNKQAFAEGHLAGQKAAREMAEKHLAAGLTPEQTKVKVKARGS